VHFQVRWVLGAQVFVTLLAGLVAGTASGLHAAISALIGGSVGFLSASAYVWRALRVSGAAGVSPDPKKAFSAQVVGEGYKFAVTLLLFAFVFKSYERLDALPLFMAYAATFIVYWIALLKQC
jgi:ATP synthase protein I